MTAAKLAKALSLIVSAVDATLPGVDVANAALRSDVERYLAVGGDLTTTQVLESGTFKAFLYLVHEMTELPPLLSVLNASPPSGGLKPVIRANASSPSRDPWLKTIGATRTRGTDGASPVQRADAAARAMEVRLEKVLARVFLGESVGLAALAWSISTSTGPGAVPPEMVALADKDARERAARELACGTASDTEIVRAEGVRRRLFALDLGAVRRFDVAHLAYAIWEARDCAHGRDVADWLASVTALRQAA